MAPCHILPFPFSVTFQKHFELWNNQGYIIFYHHVDFENSPNGIHLHSYALEYVVSHLMKGKLGVSDFLNIYNTTYVFMRVFYAMQWFKVYNISMLQQAILK